MKNFKQVSGMLAKRAEEIAKLLLPSGKQIGNEWCVGSVDGEAGGSLKVNLLTDDKKGVWCDFATRDSGDLLDLWSSVRKISLVAALNEAEQYLGIAKLNFQPHKQKTFAKPIPEKVMLVQHMSPVMTYLTNDRQLTVDTIKAFKVCEQKQTIVFNYHRDGDLIFRKYLRLDRPNGKKQIYTEKDCEPCLFGWDLILPNARSITICEGEIDAMSLYQYGFPTLSVPFGGGSGKKHEWIEYEFERLSVYDVIYLIFDQDSAGKEAVAELIERLGRHRCRVASLPYKDPNECLQKGVTKEEIQKCFDLARTLDPEELKSASSFVNQVVDEFYPKPGTVIGYNPPWNYAKGKIMFRLNELSIWTGINGHGKSQLLGHTILDSMQQGARVCIASLEIKSKKLLKGLTRQAAGIALPSEEYIREIHSWYEDKLWLFDVVDKVEIDRLLEVFLYARQRYGIDVFVIDSFMKMRIDEEDFKLQKRFIEMLCNFKNQHNCHVHLVVHPRKSANETEIPGKLDCKGTGAITDLADNCFTVWRNKAKEELVQKQNNGVTLDIKQQEKLTEFDCILRCDKQRNGEWEGKIGLFFDKESFQYLGHATLKAKQFVEYSTSVHRMKVASNA